MAENKTIQDKYLDMSCKHKNHTSLKHIGLKLACQDSSCKRPLRQRLCPYIMTVTLLKKEAVLPSLTATLLRQRHCPYIMAVTLLRERVVSFLVCQFTKAETISLHNAVTILRETVLRSSAVA